ncbi:hypothetical protein GCM10010145_21180 [Streptomyces ruber]|uniref:Uncharacterized protein n=2 Tax=Streptomyces TaxID=1883 RepID=A0A918BB74_9ACTN|nr:hypothetical protein [Streptomyces ruber]GGQ51622.1 hypothetical protein GCM10010145_21180 [Streptomyces ruber]
MDLTVDLAVLLGVILVVLLARPVAARKRWDQILVVAIAIVLGILIAPTDFGQSILNSLGRVTHGFS